MSEYSTIARPYARALFNDACEFEDFSRWQTILDALTLVVRQLCVERIIGNPLFSKAQLQSLCLTTLTEVVPLETPFKERLTQFIELVLTEKRLLAIPDIAEQYEQLVFQYQSIVEVEVVVASALTLDQKTRLEESLKQRFQSHIKAEYKEDAALIGGLMIKSDNWVFDGSIYGKLKRLAETVGTTLRG